MSHIPLLQRNMDVRPVTFQESIGYLKKWFYEQNRVALEKAKRAEIGRKW